MGRDLTYEQELEFRRWQRQEIQYLREKISSERTELTIYKGIAGVSFSAAAILAVIGIFFPPLLIAAAVVGTIFFGAAAMGYASHSLIDSYKKQIQETKAMEAPEARQRSIPNKFDYTPGQYPEPYQAPYAGSPALGQEAYIPPPEPQPAGQLYPPVYARPVQTRMRHLLSDNAPPYYPSTSYPLSPGQSYPSVYEASTPFRRTSSSFQSQDRLRTRSDTQSFQYSSKERLPQVEESDQNQDIFVDPTTKDAQYLISLLRAYEDRDKQAEKLSKKFALTRAYRRVRPHTPDPLLTRPEDENQAKIFDLARNLHHYTDDRSSQTAIGMILNDSFVSDDQNSTDVNQITIHAIFKQMLASAKKGKQNAHESGSKAHQLYELAKEIALFLNNQNSDIDGSINTCTLEAISYKLQNMGLSQKQIIALLHVVNGEYEARFKKLTTSQKTPDSRRGSRTDATASDSSQTTMDTTSDNSGSSRSSTVRYKEQLEHLRQFNDDNSFRNSFKDSLPAPYSVELKLATELLAKTLLDPKATQGNPLFDGVFKHSERTGILERYLYAYSQYLHLYGAKATDTRNPISVAASFVSGGRGLLNFDEQATALEFRRYLYDGHHTTRTGQVYRFDDYNSEDNTLLVDNTRYQVRYEKVKKYLTVSGEQDSGYMTVLYDTTTDQPAYVLENHSDTSDEECIVYRYPTGILTPSVTDIFTEANKTNFTVRGQKIFNPNASLVDTNKALVQGKVVYPRISSHFFGNPDSTTGQVEEKKKAAIAVRKFFRRKGHDSRAVFDVDIGMNFPLHIDDPEKMKLIYNDAKNVLLKRAKNGNTVLRNILEMVYPNDQNLNDYYRECTKALHKDNPEYALATGRVGHLLIVWGSPMIAGVVNKAQTIGGAEGGAFGVGDHDLKGTVNKLSAFFTRKLDSFYSKDPAIVACVQTRSGLSAFTANISIDRVKELKAKGRNPFTKDLGSSKDQGSVIHLIRLLNKPIGQGIDSTEKEYEFDLQSTYSNQAIKAIAGNIGAIYEGINHIADKKVRQLYEEQLLALVKQYNIANKAHETETRDFLGFKIQTFTDIVALETCTTAEQITKEIKGKIAETIYENFRRFSNTLLPEFNLPKTISFTDEELKTLVSFNAKVELLQELIKGKNKTHHNMIEAVTPERKDRFFNSYKSQNEQVLTCIRTLNQTVIENSSIFTKLFQKNQDELTQFFKDKSVFHTDELRNIETQRGKTALPSEVSYVDREEGRRRSASSIKLN